MQKIAPHTLPPNAKSEGTRKKSDNAAQPVPAAMQLARRIRREQGVEQVRRFLIAMEPFLAPYERMAIAEHMGIRLPPSQSSSGSQTGGQSRPMNQPNTSGFSQGASQQGHAQAANGAPNNGNFMNKGPMNGPVNSGPMNSGPMNNGPMNNGPMNNGPMNNGPMNNGPMNNGPMNNGPMNNGPMNNGPMNNGPMNNGPMNNGPMNSGPMNPQMQMLNMLSQMTNSTQSGGFNPMMLAQMMGNLGNLRR